MRAIEFNFIRSDQPETDKELFFGPLQPDDVFVNIEPYWLMAHLLAHMGVFPSVSQARNNGYNKPIPIGFTDIRVGKLKTRLTILNFQKETTHDSAAE